jgi:hypothetical protein
MKILAVKAPTIFNYTLWEKSKDSHYEVYNLVELRYFDATKLEDDVYLLNMNFGGEDVKTTVSSFEYTGNFLAILTMMGEVFGFSYNRNTIKAKLPKFFFVYVGKSKMPDYSVYNLSKYRWYKVTKTADRSYLINLSFGENQKTLTVNHSQLNTFERAFNSIGECIEDEKDQ